MSRKIKIALAQIKSENGLLKANLERAINAIEEASKSQVDLIVFPELYYCGYDLSKEMLYEIAEPVDGELFQTLSKKAKELKIHIAMGYPEIVTETDDLYISFMLIDENGELVHNHRKSYVWIEDLDRVTPGESFIAFDTKFGKMGLLTCYEMEFPEPARILALNGAELVIVSSAFMDTELMEKDLTAIAVQNSMYVAGVNNISDNYKGRSLFSDQYGNVVARASVRSEEILIHTFDLDQDRRQTYPAYEDYKKLFIKRTVPQYMDISEKIMKESL